MRRIDVIKKRRSGCVRGGQVPGLEVLSYGELRQLVKIKGLDPVSWKKRHLLDVLRGAGG